MDTLYMLAKFISFAAFVVVLFYFMPRAMHRLRAKGQSHANRPWQFRLWWGSAGWIAEPEAFVALSWFALLGVMCLFLVAF